MSAIDPRQIINFWFGKEMKSHWFSSTPQIDQKIKNAYQTYWEDARQGKLDHWKSTPQGCLALCIVLDQMPLNMFRGEEKSFSTEQLAVSITKFAVEKQFDIQINRDQIAFLYMPLMHSENLDDQNQAVSLFEKAGLENNLRFARHHRELIRKFGRFPHRNAILGRESTPEEKEYLQSKQAFKG